jgi:predicted RecB family nuclease
VKKRWIVFILSKLSIIGETMAEDPGFIIKFYDKEYEQKNVLELIEAPVSAISGVTESDAEKLEKSLKIKTVKDLATNEYVRLAQTLTNFNEFAEQALDKKFYSKELMDLSEHPVNALKGLSEDDAELLRTAFNIKTISDLARNKYVSIAQTTYALAALVDLLFKMREREKTI